MPSLPEILLIEDNEDDRTAFAKAVAMSGLPARVTYASGAPEAVMRLNRLAGFAGTELPALIVLDLTLPGLRGPILLQVIRNAFGPRHVPVVVLTGSLREHDRSDCERWGISDYQVKPQSFFGLVRFVSGLARLLPPVLPAGSVPQDEERRLGSDG
jgi:CheY-like chemotaxis protein